MSGSALRGSSNAERWRKRVALGLELGQFDLPLAKVAVIAAPGEQAVGPGDGMAGKGADDDQRQRRAHRAADQSDAFAAPRP